MKNKDEELGPMVGAVIMATAALNGWEKKEPKDPKKPSAFWVNFWAGARTLLSVYRVSYALLPLGICVGPTLHRAKNGYFVSEYRQVHIFGFRVARWITGAKTKWIPDDPKFEVAAAEPMGEEVEKELFDAMSEKVAKDLDQEIVDELVEASRPQTPEKALDQLDAMTDALHGRARSLMQCTADNPMPKGSTGWAHQEHIEQAKGSLIVSTCLVCGYAWSKGNGAPLEPIPGPGDGDHMTAEEFTAQVGRGSLNDDDGHFQEATATHILPGPPMWPSNWKFIDPVPTHVVWFNK